MTYQIFVRTCSPNTVRYLEEETYVHKDDAMHVADIKTRNSDLADYYVVPHKLVHDAYEETHCMFAEQSLDENDEELFDAKWMEQIERLIDIDTTPVIILIAIEF